MEYTVFKLLDANNKLTHSNTSVWLLYEQTKRDPINQSLHLAEGCFPNFGGFYH